MAFSELLRLALSALVRNKLRAFLTVLGIIVGVGAIITMIGIGEGSRRASVAVVQSMGSNMLTIFPGAPGSHSHHGPQAQGAGEILQEDDALLIQRELGPSSVHAATPQVHTTRPVIYQNTNYVTQIQGTGEAFLAIRGWEVERGRFITAEDVQAMAKVCVIGQTVKENLFPNGEDPIGETVRIGRLPLVVVGLLERKGAGLWGDQDDLVVAPFTTVMRKVMGRTTLQRILVSAHEGESTLAEMEITALLRQHLNVPGEQVNPFSIRKQDDLIQAMDRQAEILTGLLALAAGISLIVGGIGISNIMLVSVQERTHEIGLRRAAGARRREVLGQFLLEAVVLSGLGGVLGIAAALGAALVLPRFQIPMATEAWPVGLGLGFSAVIGVVAGILPALKAARMDVVEALRFE